MNTADDFKQSGYVVIKNILDSSEVDRLYRYTLQQAERGNMDDGQVPGSPSFYQDKEVVGVQKKLLPLVENVLNLKLKPVFCYNRVYRTGAVLRMHKDSSRAEISATINLGQQGDPWDLWLVDYNENTRQIVLNPGDALIYYGSRLHHWRGKLTDSDYVSQIMFHCVDQNGKHALAANMEIIRKLRKKMRELFGKAY